MKKIVFFMVCAVIFSGTVNAFEFGDVKVHGFLSQGFVKSDKYDYQSMDTNDGTVEFNELGINFNTNLNRQLRAGLQLRAADLGDFGNNKIQIDWAYGDYRLNNFIGLRVGKFRRSIGLFNETRDIDATQTVIFLPPTIAYNETYRDVSAVLRGACFYGMISALGIDYQLMWGLGGITNDGGIARRVESELNDAAGLTLADFDKVQEEMGYTIHLQWHVPYVSDFTIGGTTLNIDTLLNNGISDSPVSAVRMKGTSNVIFMKYVLGDMVLASEYCWQDSELIVKPFNTPMKSKPESYYAMLTYRFTDWLELGAYYMESFYDRTDKDGVVYVTEIMMPKEGEPLKPYAIAWLKDAALTARFDINDFWILKVEGHAMNGLENVDYSSRTVPDDNWYLFAMKASYSF